MKHIAKVNNTNILVVLMIFDSFMACFAVFFICDTHDKTAVTVSYNKTN